MAHTLQIADDTRNLVSRVVAQNDHQLTGTALELQCRATLRDVRATQYNRTNQFEVERQLDGLEEKFAVLNNDALAHALSESRSKLAAISYEYSPELLSLLLLLSDRPAEKTRLDDLQAEASGDPATFLTWKDVLADDPLEDDSIWDFIENGSHSSGYVSHDEEFKVKPFCDNLKNQFAGSDEQQTSITAHSTKPAKSDLASLRASRTQSRQTPDPSQTIRLVIRGLQGLSTTEAVPDRGPAGMLASSTLRPILAEVDSTCKSLGHLRGWSRSFSSDALTQRLKHVCCQWSNEFDTGLARIEEACMNQDADMNLTLPAILDTINAISQPVILLHQIINYANDENRPWEVLEALYNQCAILDLSAQPDLFQRFAGLFRAMLLIYLSPFGAWMSKGALTQGSTSVPFALKTDSSSNLGSLWHEHYEIKSHGNAPDTVPFMREHVTRMFACGKSAAFLIALKQEPEQIPTASDYFTEAVVQGPEVAEVSTFVERFNTALHLWLHDSYGICAARLTHTLLTKQHLGEVTSAIGNIFLGGNGLNMDEFAQPLYESLATGATLSDIGRTTLSGLVQTSFEAELKKAHLEHALTLSLTPIANSTDHFDDLSIHLSLPWPIQNITREREPTACQNALMTLLRLHRARYQLAHLSMRTLGEKSKHCRAQLVKLRHGLRWLFDTIYACICDAGSELTVALSSRIKESRDIEAMADAYQQFKNGVAAAFLLDEEAKPAKDSLAILAAMPERLKDFWVGSVDTDESGRLLTKLHREFQAEWSRLSSTLRLMKTGTSTMASLVPQLTAFHTEDR